jgi:protocatechuate 3,4-dioxygenase beta subunit
VRTEDGAPVEWASVATAAADPIQTSALTDADGVYTLNVSEGVYSLTVSKYGLPSPPARIIAVPPDQTGIDFNFFTPYTIQGTVRTSEGEPVVNAYVATGEDDPLAAVASTDANGDYTLIVSEGVYHIQVSAFGLPSPPPQVVSAPPSRTGIDFTTPPLMRIQGSVRDEAGQPIAEASVGYGVTAVAATAADGSYTLAVAPGEHFINVYKRGYDTGSYASVLVPNAPTTSGVDFVLRIRNRTIRGRVTDGQGRPVDLAMVYASNPLDHTGVMEKTDANGVYTLTVAAGVYWVYTTREYNVFDPNPEQPLRYVPSQSQEVDVSQHSAQAIDFTIEPAAALLRGTVHDSSGQPVERAAVAATSVCGAVSYSEPTDASGTYAIVLPPGTYSVHASKDGLPGAPAQTVSISPEATVNFTFPQPYAITGRAVDPQGQPLAEVLIEASAHTRTSDSDYDYTLTDGDGRYTLIVAAGAYTVSASHGSLATPPVQTATVPPERTDVNFVLAPRLPRDQETLLGMVYDEEGRPAANAILSVAGVPNAQKIAYFDGSYALALDPGTYSITAGGVLPMQTFGAGGRAYVVSAPQQITLPANQTGLNFTVRRADQFIFGQVTDAAGHPLCDVHVEATGEGTSASARTDSSGRYALRLPDGTYTLRASASGYPASLPQTVTVPPTAIQRNFRLEAPANTVEGVVRDHHGIPVAGASVLASHNGVSVAATTDAGGVYILPLSNGSWKITASHPAFVASPTSRSVVVPPNQREVDFALTPTDHLIYLPLLVTKP